jgi:hypothetical protein
MKRYYKRIFLSNRNRGVRSGV